MAFDIGSIISTVISSIITTIIIYIVLKIMKDGRGFLRVFIVVFIANIVGMFLPYISTLGIPLPWYVFLIISIVVSLFIYKYGLDLTWGRTIILVILTPVIAIIITFILAFLGLGAIWGLGLLA